MVPENQNLTYSKQGLRLTEDFEGFRSMPYKDQNGVWTDGYGNTHNVVPGKPLTQEQAGATLADNVAWAEKIVRTITNVPLTQGEFDACVDFTFNCGSGNFARSSVLRYLNAGNKEAARSAFMLWDKVAGQVNKGLARRRLAEEELFDSGLIGEE